MSFPPPLPPHPPCCCCRCGGGGVDVDVVFVGRFPIVRHGPAGKSIAEALPERHAGRLDSTAALNYPNQSVDPGSGMGGTEQLTGPPYAGYPFDTSAMGMGMGMGMGMPMDPSAPGRSLT